MAFPPAHPSAHAPPNSYRLLLSARACWLLGDRPRAPRNLPSLCLIQQMRLRAMSFVRFPPVLREPVQQHSRAEASVLVTKRTTALRVLASAPSYLRVRGTNSAADPRD